MTTPSLIAETCPGDASDTLILGAAYGRKQWTPLEADRFRDRLERGQVIPIRARSVAPTPFDSTRAIGGLDSDESVDLLTQAKEHAEVISRKLALR